MFLAVYVIVLGQLVAAINNTPLKDGQVDGPPMSNPSPHLSYRVFATSSTATSLEFCRGRGVAKRMDALWHALSRTCPSRYYIPERLTRQNWAHVFSHLCWPELQHQITPEDYPYDCIFVDLLLSLRHYHPVVGYSTWIPQHATLNKRMRKSQAPSKEKTSHHDWMDSDDDESDDTANGNNRAIMMGVSTDQLLGMIGLLVLVGTLVISLTVRRLHQHAWRCFNVKHHYRSFCQPVPSSMFSFFEGLRVICMMWIIYGHCCLFHLTFTPFPQVLRYFSQHRFLKRDYCALAAALAVDIFFFISGTLTGYRHYQSAYQLLTSDGCKNRTSARRVACWLLKLRGTLFTRYLRLIVPTALYFFIFMASGFQRVRTPSGVRFFQASHLSCEDNVVPILTLTSNLFPKEIRTECFGWTWYLSNDFQFFILGLFLMPLAVITPVLFQLLVWSLVIVSVVLAAATAYAYRITLTVPGLPEAWLYTGTRDVRSYTRCLRSGRFLHERRSFPMHPLFDYYYVKPWVRLGPHLLGLFLGVSLAKCKLKTEDNHARTSATALATHAKETSLSGSTECSPALSALESQSTTRGRMLSEAPCGSCPTTIEAREHLLELPHHQKHLGADIRCRTNPLVAQATDYESNQQTEEAGHPLFPGLQRWTLKFLHSARSPISLKTTTTRDTLQSFQDVSKSAQLSTSERRADYTSPSDPLPLDPQFLPGSLQYVLSKPLLLGTLTSGILFFLILYVHVAQVYPHLPWGRTIDALYMGIQRPLMGIALIAFTLLMVFNTTPPPQRGRGWSVELIQVPCNIIRAFLSHPFWTPFSRLSFTAYLIHPLVILFFYASGYGSPIVNDRGRVLTDFLLNLTATLTVAFLLHLFVESPLAALIKCLLPSNQAIEVPTVRARAVTS